jgi:predicted amino acid dehydrogenase
LDDNHLCGEFYVKEEQLQGTSFTKGASVIYEGYPATVQEEKDEDGDIKISSMAGALVIANALKQNATLQSIRYDTIDSATPEAHLTWRS